MKRAGLPLFLLLSILTIGRLFFIRSMELLPDEAYYWTWSLHLQPCYYDHPPLVAWFIACFHFLGVSELAVRLSAVLLSALAALILSRHAWELAKGASADRAAVFTLILTQAVLLFSVGAVIMTPDTPLVFFWIAALYAFWRAVRAQDAGPSWGWWTACGAAVGLGMLSKYTMVLFLPSAALFLALTPQRRWLARWQPYAALIIAGAVFLPVVLWNASHGWVSFAYQWGHGVSRDPGAGWRTFLDFLGGQALVATPILFLAMLGVIMVNILSWWKVRGEREAMVLCFSMPVFLFFGWASFRGPIEANWAVCGYPVLLLGLSFRWAERWPARKRWILGVIASAAVLTIVAHVVILRPFPPFRADQDILKRHYGWKQMGQEAARLMDSDPSLVLAAESYQIGSELLFYSGRRQLIFLGGVPIEHPVRQLVLQDPKGRHALLVMEGAWDRGILRRFTRHGSEELLTIRGRQGEIVKIFSFVKCYNLFANP